MFKAIGRYLKALGYFVTGRVDAARRTLSTNPHVVRATYDNIIEEKTKRIAQYKDAVAGLITQEEKKLARIKGLSDEVNHLEQLKQGAAAKARQLVVELKGKGLSMDEIKANEEYKQCLVAFNDFSSTVEEKGSHIGELEVDVTGVSESIAGHKLQLQQLVREIDTVKDEASGAVADMITAREEQELADMISGISLDNTSKELQEMRDLRNQMKANARISRELAGTDSKRQEAEFLEYARNNAANDEFEQLIGLAEETDAGDHTSSEAPTRDTRLPEG